MTAGIAPGLATAVLTAFVAAKASADESSRLHVARMHSWHPVTVTSWAPRSDAPLLPAVSAADQEVIRPRQAAAARSRVESMHWPLTPAQIAAVALLILAVIVGLAITFGSLRDDIRSKRRVYRRRAHRSGSRS